MKMLRKRLLLTFVLSVLALLAGCDFYAPKTSGTSQTTSEPTGITTTESECDLWKNSDDAEDFNEDRKIDEADYEIYQMKNSLAYWKKSAEATDLNGDRKIDATDFEIYKLHNYFDYWIDSEAAEDLNGDSLINEIDFDIYDNYDYWINSIAAEDLNDDSKIDISDFEIYIEYEEFQGEYYLSNYNYYGSPGDHIKPYDIAIKDLGFYLSQIQIIVNSKGRVVITIPEAVRTAFGHYYSVLLSGANNMTISRISPLIVGIDTFVVIDDVNVNVTLYLSEIDNGFTTSYVIGFYDEKPSMTLDIIKVE